MSAWLGLIENLSKKKKKKKKKHAAAKAIAKNKNVSNETKEKLSNFNIICL